MASVSPSSLVLALLDFTIMFLWIGLPEFLITSLYQTVLYVL